MKINFKKLFSFLLVILSLSVLAETATTAAKTNPKKKNKVHTSSEAVATEATAKGLEDLPKKPGEPCDTKEDILKKLEEEKKKQKAFSLQGGNTGCSVDKK